MTSLYFRTNVANTDTLSTHHRGGYFNHIVQINYEFYFLTTDCKCTTNDDTYDLCYLLCSQFKMNLTVEASPNFLNCVYDFQKSDNKSFGFSKYQRPREISFKKSTYHIENIESEAATIELDVSEYLKRAEVFKNKNPEYHGDINKIVAVNMLSLSAYYKVPVKKIISTKDKVSLIINRINNLKQVQ